MGNSAGLVHGIGRGVYVRASHLLVNGGNTKLSVWSIKDHMMSTGGTPKINTLSESWGVAG